MMEGNKLEEIFAYPQLTNVNPGINIRKSQTQLLDYLNQRVGSNGRKGSNMDAEKSVRLDSEKSSSAIEMQTNPKSSANLRKGHEEPY